MMVRMQVVVIFRLVLRQNNLDRAQETIAIIIFCKAVSITFISTTIRPLYPTIKSRITKIKNGHAKQ